VGINDGTREIPGRKGLQQEMMTTITMMTTKTKKQQQHNNNNNNNTNYTFIYLLILFPYIPFRYIPWKWKMSHAIYIIRQLAHGVTSIAKVEKYVLINYSNNYPKLTLNT
jgi:lysophospholipase L1-like esterase